MNDSDVERPVDPLRPPGDREQGDDQPDGLRRLSANETTAVAVVAALVGVLGLLGFVNSFAAVMTAAEPSFGRLAWSVPVGIDLGIAIFAALDIVLSRLDMRVKWLRLIPWVLTAATVYLNVASEHTAFGAIAHAVLPALWVIAVEIGAHVVKVRAGIEAGTRMDAIRASRWVLAPWPTAKLWRRMVLWEIRSYPTALHRERDRLLARTDLQDTYGTVAWRWKAPRRTRALYRLGELSPGAAKTGGPSPEAPAVDSADRSAIEAGPSAPTEADPSAPIDATDRKTVRKTAERTVRRPSTPRTGGRSRTGKAATRRTGKRSVPDVDDLMPLGWRITADLETRGLPLKRDTLAAELRNAGQPVGSERVGALLARLKTEAPTDPTTDTPDDRPADVTAAPSTGDDA
jgi:hypothetical protein